MLVRLTLSHAIAGSIQIAAPNGFKRSVIGYERHPDFHGLVKDSKSQVSFFGKRFNLNGGRDWIKSILRNYGPNAIINALSEFSVDGGFDWYVNFNAEIGILSLRESLEEEHVLDSTLVHGGAFRKLIARATTPVDIQSALNIVGNAVTVGTPEDIILTPQKVPAVYRSIEEEGKIILMNAEYLQYQPDKKILEELKTVYNLAFVNNPSLPAWVFEPEFDGEAELDLRIEISQILISAGAGNGHKEIQPTYGLFFKYNDEAEVEFDYTPAEYTSPETYDHWGMFTTPADNKVYTTICTFNDTFNFNKGDQIRIYVKRDSAVNATLAFWGTTGLQYLPGDSFSSPLPPGMVSEPSYFNIEQQTEYPQTQQKGFLQHDALAYVIDRITEQEGLLNAPVLGSEYTKARVYGSAGCYWNNLLIKGANLRGYTLNEKVFAISLKELWDGMNPKFNLALWEEGNEIRVGKKEEVYPDTEPVINLLGVRSIEMVYDDEMFFSTVQTGNEKGLIEELQGIDDPVKQTRSTILLTIGKPFKLLSKFISAGIAIESTRRKEITKAADFKLDNDTFIINVERNEDGTYNPKLDGFSSVTGLKNEETRYNKLLTPARSFIRWLNYFSCCLQYYLTSTFKFTGEAEGNYDMVSTADVTGCDDDYDGNPLGEGADIPPIDEPLFWPELYTVKHYLTTEEFLLFDANKHIPLGVSQTKVDPKKFLVKSFKYDQYTGRLQVVGWFKERFEIQNGIEYESVQIEQGGKIFDSSFDFSFE